MTPKSTRLATWLRPANWMRWHRYLGYPIGLQLLIWVMGGVVFAILPFQTWVKGKDLVRKPEATFTLNWQAWSERLPRDHGALLGFQSVVLAQGPAIRARFAQADVLLNLDGQIIAAPDQATIERFAKSIYQGAGSLKSSQFYQQLPTRLLIVKELASGSGVWQVQFDDDRATRLYFDGVSGEFLTVRSSAWLWYDFFWRLHVMDYRGGEDFNNLLLRSACLLALLMIMTGMVLSLRNVLRRRL